MIARSPQAHAAGRRYDVHGTTLQGNPQITQLGIDPTLPCGQDVLRLRAPTLLQSLLQLGSPDRIFAPSPLNPNGHL
jgi:hypothetical protein